MSSIRGWPSDRKMASTPAPHVTVEPMGKEQYGLTVRAQVYAWAAGNDLVEAGSTQEYINATGHIARLGDVIRFNSGALDNEETKVIKVEVNRIYVADLLASVPQVGDQIIIMRPRQAQVDDNGNLIVSTTSGPVQYVLDGIDTEVEESTIAPIDSRPLPVKVFRADGTSDWADDVETAVESIASTNQSMATDIDALESNFGSAAATPAPDDTGTYVFMAFVKRMLQRLTLLVTSNATIAVDTTSIAASNSAGNILIGAVTETAPATDTASSGLNGRLQRIAQNLTSLVAGTPVDVVNAANSSSTPLAGAGVFTGTAVDALNVKTITVAVFANQASAANGLSLQQSNDGTNWDFLDQYTLPLMAAGAGRVFSLSPVARYFRVVFTNGATLQTAFRLQTLLKYGPIKYSNHSLAEVITLQNDAQLAIAQMRATNGTNSIPVIADASGNMGVSLATIGATAIATGNGVVSAGVQRVAIASDSSPVGTIAPTAATVKQAALTVGLTAVRLTHDAAAPTAGRRKLSFRPDPDSAAKFWYGSSSVTATSTTRGIPVFPGESVDMVNDAGDYYIISDAASQTVYVVEQE